MRTATILAATAIALIASACTREVPVTVIVEVPVDREVPVTVVMEVPVDREVPVTVIVEVPVTATPTPMPAPTSTPRPEPTPTTVAEDSRTAVNPATRPPEVDVWTESEWEHYFIRCFQLNPRWYDDYEQMFFDDSIAQQVGLAWGVELTEDVGQVCTILGNAMEKFTSR